MTGQARADGSVAFVARTWARRVWVAACTVLGVLAAMITIGDVLSRPDPPSDDLIAVWLLAEATAAIVSALLLALLLGRRSVPAGLVLAVLAPSSAALPAALVAVVLLVSLRSRRIGGLAVSAFLGSTTATTLVVDRDEALGMVVFLAVLALVLVLVGTVVGGRRALAEQERRERDLVLEQARSQERARIAGEMHDSLSHHLSLIALHAGALGRREDLPPETVRSSSRLVAELSRTAHDELREVLGVLHQGPQSATPPAGAAGLAEVVEQHRAAGAQVRAELDPDVVGEHADQRLSDATSRLIHRVTRELLANAARHAPGAPVELVVAARGDRVELSCRNRIVVRERETTGAGMGLEGIAERVRLAGGQHGTAERDGQFVAWVSVPW